MTWVNETKIEAASEKLEEFQKWWAGRQEKQKELPLYEVPAYTKADVIEKIQKLNKEWDKLKKIKKPKEAKKDKDAAEEASLPSDVAATEAEIEDIKKKK